MFLRPTELLTVFLQQLGRGFRKDKSKKYLNIYVYLNKELGKFFDSKDFIKNVKDAIDFRTKEYYKNRFEKQ